EEFDFKEAKSGELRALQDLVSCAELRGERKGVDAQMERSFCRFVANTNAPDPIPLPADQRRCVVMVFSLVTARLLATDHVFRAQYLTRLARVLADERVWRAYCYVLWREYGSPARLDEFEREAHTLRRFNFDTTLLQLRGMQGAPETSVLAWL